MERNKDAIRVLNVKIPAKLYEDFAKRCIELGITKTAAIVQYFMFLREQDRREKFKGFLHAKHKGTWHLKPKDSDKPK